MYKISDFKDEVGNRTLSLFKNHLFLIFFLFFIVFIGTFSIWVNPVFLSEDFQWDGFVNSFNSLNLLSFSLPILVTLIFDKIVKLAVKGKVEDVALTIWLCVLFLIAIIIILLLFLYGFKSGDNFSKSSFIAWLMVLYIWVLGNVDNPDYQKKEEHNSASGGENVTRATLKAGK